MAVVENGAVQELHIERALERGLVGNIYLGKVARVLPGMQSAFIDIGLERAAFLHVADLHLAGGAPRPDNGTPPTIIYNLPQQDMVALRVTMRLGWQLPNPINRIQPTEGNRYPFATLTDD